MVRKHVLDRRPLAAVALHRAAYGIDGRQGPTGQRVLDGQDQVPVLPGPQLDLHATGRSVGEPAERLDPRPVQPEDPCLVAQGERTVRDQQRRLLLGVHGHRVERLVRARGHQHLAQLAPAGPLHGDHGSAVVAAHQQVRDAPGIERVADEHQVFDHRLVRRPVGVDHGVPALDLDDVVAVDQSRDGGRRGDLDDLAPALLGFGRTEIDVVQRERIRDEILRERAGGAIADSILGPHAGPIRSPPDSGISDSGLPRRTVRWTTVRTVHA